MDILTNPITLALFLSIVNKAIIDAIFTPVKLKFPNLDTWWIIYVAWVTGGVISYLCQIDVFSSLVQTMPPVLGLILTAVLVGGGSNLVDKFSNLMKSMVK
jgi:uncharacterized BrkB/YihY/UPF0761 family membrane protein